MRTAFYFVVIQSAPKKGNNMKGISALIKIFAWLFALVAVIFGAVLVLSPFSAGSGIGLIAGGLFVFTLLYGFAHALDLLERISEATEYSAKALGYLARQQANAPAQRVKNSRSEL